MFTYLFGLDYIFSGGLKQTYIPKMEEPSVHLLYASIYLFFFYCCFDTYL